MMADTGWALDILNPVPERLPHYEALFTVANGRIGMRGATPHLHPQRGPGTYLADLFDALPGQVTELVNLPDSTWLRLFLDGEELGTGPDEAVVSRLTLDLESGLFTARVRLRAPSGSELEVAAERFASLVFRDTVHMRVTVTPVTRAGEITAIMGLRLPGGPAHLKVVEALPSDEPGLVLQTAQNGRYVAVVSRTATGAVETSRNYTVGEEGIAEAISFWGTPGRPVTLTRSLVFLAAPAGAEEPEAALAPARAALAQATARRYEEHLVLNAAAWRGLWDKADVEIEGDPEAQLGIRYAVFQLIGSAPDRPGTSIAAKGLTGPGYRGHVFWDTELFMLPFFAHVLPETARDILTYRYLTLPGARAKARAKGFPGAMFAWESADTGEEATPTEIVDPGNGKATRIWTGERELHIVADIVHAVRRYLELTGDERFMVDQGAEIVFECARFWAARLEAGDDGRWHLRGVIGPDEYHELVDDNTFTNVMVQAALRAAADLAARMRQSHPEAWRELSRRLALSESEPASWAGLADAVYLPSPRPDGVIEQFRGFFALPSPLTIKQPDVLMLAVTLPGLYPREAMAASWDYYEPLTDHGSSLSPSIHALVARELGLHDKAAAYFRRALQIDLEDAMKNGADGLHMANLGGIWQDVVHAFAGINWRDGALECEPALPPGWKAIRCSICCRGGRFRFEVTPAYVWVVPETRPASPFPVLINGEIRYLSGPEGIKVPLSGPHAKRR